MRERRYHDRPCPRPARGARTGPALIEQLENALDVRESRKILAAMKRKGEKPVPLAQLKRELGL